ncbi:arylesterase [Parapedomonas caeni]
MTRGYGVFKRMFNPLVLSLAVLVATISLPAVAAEKLILAFGDSLTAGYGLGPGEGVVPRLEAKLRADGLKVRVHNAGVSGDTTTGGRARLAWVLASLKTKPDLVILELGANDALRGIDPKLTRANLDAMLGDLKRRKIRVLLAGMMAPRNLGQDYARAFDPIYPTLAKAHGVALYPFFLDGVAANPKLNQADGMHPNAQGVRVIVDRLAPAVKQALR